MKTNIPRPKSLAQWLTYIEALHPKSIAMGLERVKTVADRLSLKLDFPIISIAGTNGKGSTCAMLESVYTRAGYQVGAYVSPHLVRYNERVRIKQHEVSDEMLCNAFSAIEDVRGDVVLTYFEMGTLAAMWCFSQAELDVVILEVGMGGRLDAVNVFEPACAIVTSVDLDHMDYLGDTREAIAYEKAGIYRADKPAICGDNNPPQTLIDHAEVIGANLHCIHDAFEVKQTNTGWQYHSAQQTVSFPKLALEGSFQLNNAGCAVCAVECLQDELPVDMRIASQALEKVVLAGRFNRVRYDPDVLLDVAHNPQAAIALAENLKNNRCNGNTIGVFAMLADKDIAQVVSTLLPYISFWHLAAINNPRGASAEELQQYLQKQVDQHMTKCFPDVASALHAACMQASKNDRIIVFGSFYTVADAIEALNAQGI